MRPIEHASMIPICQASGNVGVGGELPTRKPRQAREREREKSRFSPSFTGPSFLSDNPAARQIAIRIDPFLRPPSLQITSQTPSTDGIPERMVAVSLRRSRSASRFADGHPIARQTERVRE